MRKKHTVQRSIFEHYAEHEIGQELSAMSAWLDQNMEVLDTIRRLASKWRIFTLIESLLLSRSYCGSIYHPKRSSVFYNDTSRHLVTQTG